jgi:hypothetical protein
MRTVVAALALVAAATLTARSASAAPAPPLSIVAVVQKGWSINYWSRLNGDESIGVALRNRSSTQDALGVSVLVQPSMANSPTR